MQEAKLLRTVIEAGRPSFVRQVRATWSYRDLALLFGRRDISVRYRQTGLGLAWVLLQPLLGALIFSFVFQNVVHVAGGGQDYFSFALSGLALWTFFSCIVSRSSLSLLSNSGLLSKASFPRLVLPMATVPAAALDLVISLVLVVVVAAFRGHAPTVDLLLLPLAVIPLALIGLGIGLICSSLSVRYRDVQQVVPVGLQLALYASPVAYPAAAVPAKLQNVFKANPLVGTLDCGRQALLGGHGLDGAALGWSWGLGIGLIILGGFIFVRREESFADVA